MTLKQLWLILRGRRTNFSWMNASWTYYPDGDPLGKILLCKTRRETVTIYVPDGYKDAKEFLRDCNFEPAQWGDGVAECHDWKDI